MRFRRRTGVRRGAVSAAREVGKNCRSEDPRQTTLACGSLRAPKRLRLRGCGSLRAPKRVRSTLV